MAALAKKDTRSCIRLYRERISSQMTHQQQTTAPEFLTITDVGARYRGSRPIYGRERAGVRPVSKKPTALARELATIDPEFQRLIPPMSPEEYTQIEANIIRDGCQEPLCFYCKMTS